LVEGEALDRLKFEFLRYAPRADRCSELIAQWKGLEKLSRNELKGKEAPRSCQEEASQKRERKCPNYIFLDFDLNLKLVNIM
jgi:hypothetical protein